MTPGSGVTLKLCRRGSLRRRIAFEEDGLAQFRRGVLDRRDEFEIILGMLRRRHEDVELAVARLEAQRGAHDAGIGLAGHRLAERPARARCRSGVGGVAGGSAAPVRARRRRSPS